jgi:endonuclease G
MHKLLLLLVSLTAPVFAQSTDTVRIVHKNYTTVFSKSLKYPLLVEWWDTKDKILCKNPLPRTDKFLPDPQLPKESDLGKDYVGSGFDRGHMSPAADNRCSGKDILEEAFYFTNMVPQPHSLNAGDWKSVETMTRQLVETDDSIHVWSGAIGDAQHIKGLVIPTKNWKVLYSPKTKTWWAYIFDNVNTKPIGMAQHIVKVEDVEKLTGFKFKK